MWNYRGESVDLSQDNTEIAVPLMMSTNGYGMFWNNTSRSRFNTRFVHALYFSSEVADAIDYYFLYGPDFDNIIADYRELTGPAPMFGKWAYGFWQCKNRYRSQEELLGVAHQYRQLHIPVDNIVQDWFWWDNKGSFRFNKNYPDPKAMVDDLHRNNFHLMISVWPFFYPGSAVYDEMDKRGLFVDRKVVAGLSSGRHGALRCHEPGSPRYYWHLMDKALFKIGADAWWLDTTEPETAGREENILTRHQTAIGSGERYANIFPLMHAAGVYRGTAERIGPQARLHSLPLGVCRQSALRRRRVVGRRRVQFRDFPAPDSRRAEFLSLRNSLLDHRHRRILHREPGRSCLPRAVRALVSVRHVLPHLPRTWHAHQGPAELSAWGPEAVDIVVDAKGTRAPSQNELWSYGPQAQKILTDFDRLRYRLMPYIYSVAWKTTSESYTPMRALVMDFRGDSRVANIGDQFLFGPAILVNPVTEPGATTRHLYLPESGWYDFWTGSGLSGGRMVDAAAPLDRIPLYIRAGSIVPMGPDVEYTTEKAADPIELRVYTGADGEFTLYEDENDNYNYEKGVYATIAFHWDDVAKRLTIGERKGSFPGMIESRTFRVVFVGPGHGAGVEPAARPDKVVPYSGKAVTVGR